MFSDAFCQLCLFGRGENLISPVIVGGEREDMADSTYGPNKVHGLLPLANQGSGCIAVVHLHVPRRISEPSQSA
jgi:hypothetical protein